ncbi:tegument protein US22 [Saimiriine betaherpesvirus 4]|uniref:Tegument protein US22 n=1 Tax=Saimiriine betaherpesvirus 4 TaxID=1535247 RepID=G8XT42_9BETA|nr:tegument protein US22 [Saimiriine betaherpesvirus 4]AEV80992.1 tegument protein US22 [Saimiriine betaherpesvirus 4]
MPLTSKSTCVAWTQYLKSHDDRPEHVVRCDFGVAYTRRSVFQQMMLMLHGLFIRMHDHSALRDYVQKNQGVAICLRNPGTWFLVLRDSSDIAPVRGRRLDREYLCCDENLMTVGVLAVRASGGEDKILSETTCVMLLGATGAVYVYDWKVDALFQVAQNLEDLAENGLMWCDSVYKHPSTPYSTVEPRYHVDRLLSADCRDVKALAEIALDLKGLNLVITTPGENTREPLLLLGDVNQLRKSKPFVAMSDEAFEEMCRRITCRLCCQWHVLGVTGYYMKVGTFATMAVVILDRFGAVYALKSEDGDLHRLADDIQMFFRIGYLKLKGSYRFDRGCRGEALLETKPHCSHWCSRDAMPAYKQYPITQEEMESCFDWLTRPTLMREELQFDDVLGRTDMVPTGTLMENQNWTFPVGSIQTLPENEDGAWQEDDIITTAFDGKRCFRAPRSFGPEEDEDEDSCHDAIVHDIGSEPNDEHRSPEKVPLSPPSPSASESSEISSTSKIHPELQKHDTANWEEVTLEKEAWKHRVIRAQLMWRYQCPVPKVSFPNYFEFPWGSPSLM